MPFYEQGRKKGDFESGIRMALQSILVSPRFLFRLEQAPPAAKLVKAARTYRISDQDLASRLSFFLWGTVPDADLMKAASARHAARRRPASRSRCAACSPIADPRRCRRASPASGCGCRISRRFIPTTCCIRSTTTRSRRRCSARPSSSSTASCARIGRVLDLLTADYTFVNERLAKHYGIPNVTGNDVPPRARLPEYRRGMLRPGQHPDADLGRRPHLAGAARQVGDGSAARLAAAAAAAERAALDDVKAAIGGKMLSTRERMEEHRKNPACTSCHRVIDPLGLALENFDATGAWRIKDNEVPIDSVGDLYDGTKMDGPAGLRAGDAEAQRRVPAELHREPDDLRARPPRRVHRHAGDSRDHPRRRARTTTGCRRSSSASSTARRSGWRTPNAQPLTRPTPPRRSGRIPAHGRGERMYITKKHISRRTVLKGIGATVALPLLDAMVPARTAFAQPRRRTRRSASSPSRWCTARPAARRSASRRTCGRRQAAGSELRPDAERR